MHFTDSSPDSPARIAVILPGADYPATAPMLYWIQGILLAAGWRVLAGAWDDDDRAASGPGTAVDAVFDRLAGEGISPQLVIGKSLGSFAALRCTAAGIPGIWLTPLLNVPDVADALSAAGPEHLLIGGGADRHWQPERLAEPTNPPRFVVSDGGHSLRVGDDWRASLDAQRLVLERVAEHVELVGKGLDLASAFDGAGLGLRRGVVELADASDAWARAFAAVHAVLTATAPETVVAIEHIGSTAVPGLDAKPILDIAIAVVPGTPLASLDGWLTGLGMLVRGDGNDVRPDRMYGYELEPMVRLMNVHVVDADSEGLRHYIAFRDHLRAHPDDREAYAALKRELAEQHPDDRIAYVDAKASLIVPRRD